MPNARFVDGENTYFVADHIGKVFAEFNECRAISENVEFLV